MKVFKYPERTAWSEILKRPVMDFDEIVDRVVPIMESVRTRGDEAVKEFAQKFDQVVLDEFLVSESEIEDAIANTDEELKKAIQVAHQNIKTFHEAQFEPVKLVETMAGVECWRKSVGIEKVGLYIPGGTAPLFSTVLMLGVPAILADCKEVILCTPSNKEGKINPAILYTANLIGLKKIYKVGGAQAVAAMTYGTSSITKVDKIFGPGNQYVTAAKQLAMKAGVAIDMPAGPSEVAVWADETAHPSFIAADLLSQAEHGVDSQVILVTTSEELIAKVSDEVTSQLEQLPRKEIAAKALENSHIILLKDEKEALDLINEYAAEHLILSLDNAEDVAEQIINAGSVFIGHYTPESAGDYASGTNHTLPTYGYAKSYSGVSLDSFVRKITFQKISKEGLKVLGPNVEIMAKHEELDAHKNAVTVRLQTLKD
ncbi:histidinol dehydrogenase [Sediminitomix flava]|uniref:Histidinol dehydrogenase n=1 Tax=Sediminitomix flava TaxID=379075 RepID=A0A315Z8E4_SEDFL|nr:histidinol dehydrogenase [Sediminitomix flava]PWJ39970.1 histidinol dehydrogenase [Sediminitomix flava]